jgi:[protein-PII] uridylyltransferase
MLQSGLLVRFIPQWADIVDRIQYDVYHLYPVDKHTLKTVQTLMGFGIGDQVSSDSLCVDLYKELKDKYTLLWAALLHDVGKGTPKKRHSEIGSEIANRVLTEKGFKKDVVDSVAFLVREHLLLVKIATRRDIRDEETAVYCARIIKDVERLKMLYLLSVADSMSTGPMAWNEWNAALVRELFLRVLGILEKGELASEKAVSDMESKQKDIFAIAEKEKKKIDIKTIFNAMSPRYLLSEPVEEIIEDMDLYSFLGDKEFVWKITVKSGSKTRTVRICAKDRPGLFSKFAGIFTLNHFNILDARIFTWQNNVALDIFELTPPPNRLFESDRWKRAEKELDQALKGTFDLAAAIKEKTADYQPQPPRGSLRPIKVAIDNKSSSFFTIIEVFTHDFTGLLFNVTDVLFKCGLDIRVAKITTKVDQVVDVFYVRDLSGQKVDTPEQEALIKQALTERLALLNPYTGTA